jgi:hypothetical protein
MHKRFQGFLSLFLLGLSVSSGAQTADSTKKVPIVISGYVDAYYAYYTDSLGPNDYQKFPSISPRSNRFGLNMAMITASYDADKVRGVVSMHFGDVAKSAWSANYNPIMEAHAGVRLIKNLWLDAGFFRTHVGTEGLLPSENIAASISLCTWHEPYFESGVRLNYTPTDKLMINLYALNGYNIFEDNNEMKSFGALITYALGTKGNIGYSNYLGDDSQNGDTLTHFRTLHNVFFNYQFGKLKTQLGLDFCTQQNGDTLGTGSAMMYSGVLGLKYAITPKVFVYGRGELFNDPTGFMSGQILNTDFERTGLKEWGGTLGFEYDPTPSSYVRLEGRQITMDAKQEIFHWDNANTNSRLEVMFVIGMSFK